MGRGRSDKTIEIVARAYAILEAQNPMTVRQVFYQLVSIRMVENRQSDYQRVSRILTVAREREEIPWAWIVDRSRPAYEPWVFDNPTAWAEYIATDYHRNYWAQQPHHVEVWTEKDAIIGSIQPVTEKYGVTVRVWRGFTSATRKQEIADRFSALDKPITVFYLGDHDPSGICIEGDAQRRVENSMYDGVRRLSPGLFSGHFYTMERLAIFQEDIALHNLPPLRIKMADSRARSFLRKHGAECVELDALPPVELRRRLEEAILEKMDREKWARCIAVERAEQKSVKEIVGRIGKTMGNNP